MTYSRSFRPYHNDKINPKYGCPIIVIKRNEIFKKAAFAACLPKEK